MEGVNKNKDSCPVEMISRGQESEKVAATYSPTWWGSTIGDGGLNFSVRNGKRWTPAAITATVYHLREILKTEDSHERIATCLKGFSTTCILHLHDSSGNQPKRAQNGGRSRAISTGRLWHCCLYTSRLSTW